MTTKPKHECGTIVSKTFKDDNGICCPFAGAVESYNEMKIFYMIVYEDGDSEELTHEVSSLLKMATSNRTIHPTPSPTAPSFPPPTTFPVDSQVTIIPSHQAHGGKDGVVTQHNKKFVVIAVNRNEARILPKSLIAHSPNPTPPLQEHNGPTNKSPPTMPLLTHAPIDDDPTPDDKELEGSMYNKLDETKNVQVADGSVSFTQTFQYLKSLISYSLRDDDNVTAHIAVANATMGALKEVWRNPHLDVYSKYLLFWAIPMNLLL
jgi:hypothetical protein